MTIQEAAELVIQAGAMAKVEGFVLDMGEPVKIYDLAKMIQLSGLKLKDQNNQTEMLKLKLWS